MEAANDLPHRTVGTRLWHLGAFRRRIRAARTKVTSAGQVGERRRHALDGLEPLARRCIAGNRAQQAAGVRMARHAEHVHGRALFDNAPGVHDAHAIGESGNDRQIVGDPDQRGTGLGGELLHLVQDLSLDRRVECGRGFVGDDQVRPVQERDGNGHSLPHAARELMRIGLQPLVGRRDTDSTERIARTVACGMARRRVVREDRLDHLRIDAEHWIQRGHRILENHRDPVAANPTHLFRGERSEVDAAEEDPSGDDAARRIDQPQNGIGSHRFARSRFADQPEHFAAPHREAHLVDGLGHAVARLEVRRKTRHRKQHVVRRGGGGHCRRRGLSASRKRSPTRLMLTMTSSKATPGKKLIQYLPDKRYW